MKKERGEEGKRERGEEVKKVESGEEEVKR